MSHQRTTSATIPYTPPPMIQRALQGAHSAVLQSNFKATAAVTVIYMHFYCCCCDSHCFILLVVIFVVIAAVGTYNIPSINGSRKCLVAKFLSPMCSPVNWIHFAHSISILYGYTFLQLLRLGPSKLSLALVERNEREMRTRLCPLGNTAIDCSDSGNEKLVAVR